MADIATVFQKTQLVLESTPGAGGTINKALQSFSIAPGIKADVKRFRPQGSKFNTIAALGKEWTESQITGLGDYNEITFLLASIIQKVTPTGASTAKTWTMSIAQAGADTIATYAVENGSADRAMKFYYGLVTTLGLAFSRASGADLSGSMLGRAIQDGVTFTSSGVTSPTQAPILGSHLSVYLADTYAGLAGASEFDRPFNLGFNAGNRYAPIWAMKRSEGSFAGHVEAAPDLSMALKVEADTAGMGMLANMRAGSKKFVRLQAIGPVITTGVYYTLQIDMCGTVGEPKPFEDVDGVYAIEWPLVATYDATWTKALEIVLINTLASLS